MLDEHELFERADKMLREDGSWYSDVSDMQLTITFFKIWDADLEYTAGTSKEAQLARCVKELMFTNPVHFPEYVEWLRTKISQLNNEIQPPSDT